MLTLGLHLVNTADSTRNIWITRSSILNMQTEINSGRQEKDRPYNFIPVFSPPKDKTIFTTKQCVRQSFRKR